MFGLLGAVKDVSFIDDFDRADNPAIGNGWTEVGPWEIASNTARRVAAGAGALNAIYRTGSVTDGYAECVPLTTLIGPTTRWDPALLNGYIVHHNLTNTRLLRITLGSIAATLGTSTSLADLASDSLTLESVGSLHRVYLNGSEIIEATEGSYASGVRGILTLDDTNLVAADNYAEGLA